jgi:hypothetical protein
MTKEGVQIGQALKDFEGVLTGVPRWVGSSSQVISEAK